MNRFLVSLAVISCLLLQFPFPGNAQTSNIRYRIEDLGALPGENPANASFAYGINSIGQVCGTALSNSGSYFPFRWTNGIMQNLGSLGGANTESNRGAVDINDFGFVTGGLRTADNKVHAYVYNNSTLIDLGVGVAGFPSGGDQTQAGGINNRGEIVGSQTAGTVSVGFYYDGTTLRNINTLIPAASGWNIRTASEINERREIVGNGLFNNASRAYRFAIGESEVVNLGTLYGANSSSFAASINNFGRTTGTSSTDPVIGAFVHTDATGLFALQSPLPCSSNSFAMDINTRGAIVGNASPITSGCGPGTIFVNRAALWLPSGQSVDLNNLIDPSLGWTLSQATDINDRGQIVGNGKRIINGTAVDRAFRLTPIRPENNQVSDFDGDGRTDLAVYRPNGGFWYASHSSNNSFSAAQFGASTDRLAPGDFDGDGRTDTAVYRDGNWFILQSGNSSFRAVQFGLPADVPTAADFDADGKTDIAVFRPSNGYWYLLRSTDNSFAAQQFGQAGDRPAVGDYDGDARADYAVFRPASGVWFVLQSTLGFRSAQLGVATDRVVQGDYDGDGRTDFAVFRPSDGNWHLLQSQNGLLIAQFGASNDEPVPGDYDGDGKFDISVYRGGTWYLQQTTGGFRAAQFGSPGDKPIPAAYLPPAN